MSRIYTIHQNLPDYPGKYVLRVWRTTGTLLMPMDDKKPVAVDESLEVVRSFMPLGYTCIGQRYGDDPDTLETWVLRGSTLQV